MLAIAPPNLRCRDWSGTLTIPKAKQQKKFEDGDENSIWKKHTCKYPKRVLQIVESGDS